MAEIIIPHEAIVVICGPSCAGKSTLAQRIFQQSPQTSKYIFSVDREMLLAMEKVPELRPYRERLPPGVGVRMEDFPDEVGLKLAIARASQLAEALSRHHLTIYDGIFLSWEELANQLHRMCMAFGNHRPMILIKVLPSQGQYLTFCNERQREANRPHIPIMQFLAQWSIFARNIMSHDFTSDWLLKSDFREYAITNPYEINLVTK